MQGDPGQTKLLTGNVTTRQWIKPGVERDTRRALGFHRGRLAEGDQIVFFCSFLLQLPAPEEFTFEGTTLRSGVRLGLPLGNKTSDSQRVRVHDQILAERGKAGHRALQAAALNHQSLCCDLRLAKVLPALRHSDAMAPDHQDPMGGGRLKWTISRPQGLLFLVAAEVGTDGVARTPHARVNLHTGGYDARAHLRRYMMTAPF